jgi:hypothetical protein
MYCNFAERECPLTCTTFQWVDRSTNCLIAFGIIGEFEILSNLYSRWRVANVCFRGSGIGWRALWLHLCTVGLTRPRRRKGRASPA